MPKKSQPANECLWLACRDDVLEVSEDFCRKYLQNFINDPSQLKDFNVKDLQAAISIIRLLQKKLFKRAEIKLTTMSLNRLKQIKKIAQLTGHQELEDYVNICVANNLIGMNPPDECFQLICKNGFIEVPETKDNIKQLGNLINNSDILTNFPVQDIEEIIEIIQLLQQNSSENINVKLASIPLDQLTQLKEIAQLLGHQELEELLTSYITNTYPSADSLQLICQDGILTISLAEYCVVKRLRNIADNLSAFQNFKIQEMQDAIRMMPLLQKKFFQAISLKIAGMSPEQLMHIKEIAQLLDHQELEEQISIHASSHISQQLEDMPLDQIIALFPDNIIVECNNDKAIRISREQLKILCENSPFITDHIKQSMSLNNDDFSLCFPGISAENFKKFIEFLEEFTTLHDIQTPETKEEFKKIGEKFDDDFLWYFIERCRDFKNSPLNKKIEIVKTIDHILIPDLTDSTIYN